MSTFTVALDSPAAGPAVTILFDRFSTSHAISFLSSCCPGVSSRRPAAAVETIARSSSTAFNNSEIKSALGSSCCSRKMSNRSSTTWANPASSPSSNEVALPLMVWATRKILCSSSGSDGLDSICTKACSIESRPSSDSTRNDARTASRSKSAISAIPPLVCAPRHCPLHVVKILDRRHAIGNLKDQPPAMLSRDLFFPYRDSRSTKKIFCQLNIPRPQRLQRIVPERARPAENLRLQMPDFASQRHHLLQQF